MKKLLVFALVCALLCPAALADVQSQVSAPVHVADRFQSNTGRTVIDEENKMIYGLEFSVTQAGLLAEYLDVDGNGTIEAADARLALRASVHLTNEPGDVTEGTEGYQAADYDKNGKVESSDARCILRVSVKLDPFG